MNKVLVFDMDGTIADLYSVEGWLEMLRSYNPTPYIDAKPLCNMEKLRELLLQLKTIGYLVVVTSWLSKESTAQYDKQVRQAKREWLEKFNFPYDEIHLVQYGTTKANCTRKHGGYQILIDDNEHVRNGWHLGDTIDASQKNILQELSKLL